MGAQPAPSEWFPWMVRGPWGMRPQGLVEPGNIDLADRPHVPNPDGSISTVRSITTTGDDGLASLIPTVSDDGRILSNPDAIDLYLRTGRNLGRFTSEDTADQYAQRLHDQQASALDRMLADQTAQPAPRLKGTQ